MRVMVRVHNSPSKHARKTARRARAEPRKRPIQARSKHMVAMIMRAATRILIKHGYDALNTNLVAQQAGASVGSLYQYFSSKEALVAALVEDHVEVTMRALRKELPQIYALPVARATERMIQLMFEAHEIDPELHRVFFEQLPRVGDFAKLEASLDESMALVQAYLEAHADELVPKNHALTAFVLVSTVEALTHRAVIARPMQHAPAEVIAEITRLVHGYLLPPTAEAGPQLAGSPRRSQPA
jgi:AcrR family transcriptional regulator